MSFNKLKKGKSLTWEVEIDADITGWKIRAEICDGCHRVKLATQNSGGSDEQILITDPTNGIFEIYIPEGATDCFEDQGKLEIEAETDQTVGGKPEVIPIFEAKLILRATKIDWDTPDE